MHLLRSYSKILTFLILEAEPSGVEQSWMVWAGRCSYQLLHAWEEATFVCRLHDTSI